MSHENLSIRQKIDQECDRFEASLKAGESPQVNAYLRNVLPEHCEQLRCELLLLQQDYDRNRSGFEPTMGPDHADKTTPESEATIDSNFSPHESMVTVGEKLKYFGNYEILGEIARGGMGVVYRARQTTLGRVVALKMILSGKLAGEHEIARFQSEAEAAANLDHPGIVPIYEVGRYDDHHYFSMGMIDGPSLSQVIREGPMEPRIAANCLAKIADAVGYANDQGVIHRDLKPGNILLDAQGNPHVTDFGLAKRLEADKELTTSGEILGTPAYMPPEQARGDLEAIGPASDVYALGAILYAMLSGRPPHSAPSMMETLRQVIEVDAVSIRTLSPGTPKDLETICAKCLAKDPAKRYAGANELRAELERFERGEPIHARPVSKLERGWRWARRRPGLASLSAALMLLIGGLAVGGPIVAINQAKLKQTAQDNEARANQLAASEREAKDRSNRSLYARTISLAFQELQSGNLMGAEDMLASLPAADRGFEWGFVHSLCHRELQSFTGMNAVAKFVAIAPDGDHVVAGGSGDTDAAMKRHAWSISSGLPLATDDGRAIAVSPDGAWIVSTPKSDPSTFQVIDSITGKVRQSFSGHEGGVYYAAFGGPDDSLIATVGRDKTYRVWNIATAAQTQKITVPHRGRLHPIALSPDGKLLAWRRGDDGAIELRETDGGRIRFEGPAQPSLKNRDMPVAFSPDGKLVALGGLGEVSLIYADSGASAGKLHGIRAHALCLDFSPDGGRLAVGSQDGTIRVFDVPNRKLLTSITGHEAGQGYGIAAVAFDVSGDRMVTGGLDTEIKIWDAWNGDRESIAESTRPSAELPTPSQSADFIAAMPQVVETLGFTSDSQYLLAAGRGGTAMVLDAATGKTVRHIDDLEGNQAAIDFDVTSGCVVVGAGSIQDRRPGAVLAFDVASGKQLWKFDDTRGPVSCLRFFDDAKRIAVAVGSQNTTIGFLLVIDSQSGEVIWRSRSAILPIRELDVSPDHQTIVTVGLDNGITMWDAATGSQRKRIGERPFYSVCYSADGKQIATGGVDWSVRLFDVHSGAEIWNQIRHRGSVMRVRFAESGSRLVSTSVDGHTHIWDTRYGDLILSMRDSDESNLALAVSPDGSTIAVAGINPTIVLRRNHASGQANQINPDGTLADSQSWTTVIKDDFERSEIGEAWNAIGGWKIEDGSLVGELVPTPYAPGLNAANLSSKTLLSSDFEISFDSWIDSPMTVQASVLDSNLTNSISAVFIGMEPAPFNRGEKGVAVVQASDGVYREVGSRREGSFTFDIGRRYRLTVRRVGKRIDLFIDSELYRTVQLAVPTPMPVLLLQGMFGRLGGKVHLDNVVVRVPPEGRIEMDVIKLVAALYDSEEIKPLVVAKLKQLDESSFGDQPLTMRSAAIEIASHWLQDETAILTKIESLATEGKALPAVYRDLHNWIDKSIRLKDQRAYRAASMCAFRVDDRAAAWEALKQADQIHKREEGFRHPIDLALSAVMMWKGTNQKIAQAHLREINQIMLADHWQADPQAVAWVKLARESIESPKADPVFDALSQVTWDQQHGRVIRGDIAPLDRSLAPDAIREIRRNRDDQEYQLFVQREDWIRSEKIWAMSGPASLKKLVRHGFSVAPNGPSPTATSFFTMEDSDSSFSWTQTDRFQREPDVAPEKWKIIKQLFRPTRIEIGPVTYEVGRDGWKELDRQVDIAKRDGNAVEELFRLKVAGRLEEALETAKQIASEDTSAIAQVNLAEIAQWCGDSTTVISAAKKAVEIDPLVPAPAPIRAIAAKQLAAEKPFQFAGNATVRPPRFYRWASKKLLAAGEGGLGSWQPTDDSLIGLTRLPPQPSLSLEDYVEAIIHNRKVAYSVQTIGRRMRTIDGFPAAEFVQRGSGVGRAIMQSGKPTVQRFVLIDRVVGGEGDRFLAFVTSYETDFPMREAEFEQFLLSMKLRPQDSVSAEKNDEK